MKPAARTGTGSEPARRRGLRAVGAILATALTLGLLLAAAAEGARAPSNVLAFTGGEFGPDHETVVIGVVRSPNRRCLSGRRIEVTLTKDGERIPLDVARSGSNGGWQARGPSGLLGPGVTAIHLELEKRRVGSGPGALRCRGDRETLS